jgi:prepilin-type N-terminal cleavage/methylation domain-containing protein
MQKHQTHKGVEGFTLIEMLIVIAIIAILASVAIPQYSQYKIRGYDANSKQALKDILLLCNAYWLDTSALQGCDLPKIKEPTYGFNQNADVVATLPSLPQDNFCASAKHNDSPNTFSIDSAALISSGSGCTGSSGTEQTASLSPAQTFEGYQPPEEACAGRGAWLAVGIDGKPQALSWYDHKQTGVRPAGTPGVYRGPSVMTCNCDECGPGGDYYDAKKSKGMFPQGGREGAGLDGSGNPFADPAITRWVFAVPETHPCWGRMLEANGGWEWCLKGMGTKSKYDFATGMWINDQGQKYKNGMSAEWGHLD